MDRYYAVVPYLLIRMGRFVTLSGFVIGLMLVSPETKAFPTMVSHGYTTCLTCHYSPSGGGALTNYGKFIAGEMLGSFNDSSTALPWLRNPNYEEGFAANFFEAKLEPILGAQGRVVQTEFENEDTKKNDLFLMQTDVEAGLSFGKLYGIIQAGLRGASAESTQRDSDLNVRQWYVGARDMKYAVRVGRFFPEFGIRHPNHNLPTRKGLFFNHNQEPLMIQGSLYFKQADITVGYLQGFEKTALANKYGVTATATFRTAHTRTGISHLNAQQSGSSVEALSVFSAVGFLENGFLMAEAASKTEMSNSRRTDRTELGFLEAGWEFYRGVTVYTGYQHTLSVNASNLVRSIPIGLRLFPITHFEFDLEFARQFFDLRGVTSTGHSAFLMAHFYF